MNLVAMMIVRNEWDRYLVPCLESLMGFCDEIRILDDCSDDEWNQQAVWAFPPAWEEKIKVKWGQESAFYANEGAARQVLLDWTMEANPTHILAIDADEFVADGQQLRLALEQPSKSGAYSLVMQEVWQADRDRLAIRQDGGWKEHPVGICFAVPANLREMRQVRRQWRIPPRALASGRVPIAVAAAANRAHQGTPSGTEILHFGWANVNTRDARYQRYVTHDGGRHHAGSHLESIMWADDRVELTYRTWPPALDKEAIYARANT